MPNSWTVTPARRATMKWPNSWMTTSTTRMTSSRTTLIRPLPRPMKSNISCRRSSVVTVAASPGADLGIECDQLVEARLLVAVAESLDGVGAQLGDAREVERAVQESVDGDLVGGDQRGARARALAAGGAADGERRKARLIDAARRSVGGSSVRSTARRRRGQVVGIGQRVLDGDAHVG